MASSLFDLQYNVLFDVLGDLFDVTLSAVCLLGSDELLVYDHIYVFIHESYLSLLISYMHVIALYFFFKSLI